MCETVQASCKQRGRGPARVMIIVVILFSCTPVSRARTTLFLSSPLFSCLSPLSWPATPAFANLYFRRLDLGRRVPPAVAGCRRVPPGAAGCRRAPPQKSLFFIGFSYIGVPKSLKIVVFSMFFEQNRWKSLKIVVFLLFFEQIRPKSLKIVVFLLFFVHFPSNIAKNCDYI